MNENENCTKVQMVEPRRPKMYISAWGINHLRRTHPWMAAWLSAATPGFGHIYLGMYAKGLTFISLEIIVNTLGRVNLGILYTFTFPFEKIKEQLNFNWAMIYAALYVFSIWDSYRLSIDINKQSFLEAKQSIRNLKHAMVSSFDLNFLDNPSLYTFSIYDAYASAVSYNRIFEEEQMYYLNGKYGNNRVQKNRKIWSSRFSRGISCYLGVHR